MQSDAARRGLGRRVAGKCEKFGQVKVNITIELTTLPAPLHTPSLLAISKHLDSQELQEFREPSHPTARIMH